MKTKNMKTIWGKKIFMMQPNYDAISLWEKNNDKKKD